MRLIRISVTAVVVVVGLACVIVLLVASRLPQHHTAYRSIHLNRKAADAYASVRDFASSATWRTDVKRVEMLGVVDGHLRFKEDGPNGLVTYELVEDVPERKIVTRIADTNLGYSGTWTYLFEPTAGGSTVRITEDGDVPNLFFRFMSRFVFGHTATIDAYLK